MAKTWWTILLWSSCMSAVAAIQKLTSTQGEEVLIPCLSNDNTSRKADWWFMCPEQACTPVQLVSLGRVVNGNAARFSLIKDSESTTSLRIAAVRTTDTGTFTCIPDGGQNEEWVVTHLSVFDSDVSAPTISIVAFSVDTVVLPCHVDNDHPPVDWWYQRKPNTPADQICSAGYIGNGYKARYVLDRSKKRDQNLVIHDIQASESGLYTCIAEAGIGKTTTIRANILVSAAADQILTETTSAGATVQLQCTVTPSSVVSWWYETYSRPGNGMTEVSQLGHIFNSFANKAELIRNTDIGQYDLAIHNVAPDDSGLYTCIENFIGDGMGRRIRVVLVVKDDSSAAQSKTFNTAEHDHQQTNTFVFMIFVVAVILSVVATLTYAHLRRRRQWRNMEPLVRFAEHIHERHAATDDLRGASIHPETKAGAVRPPANLMRLSLAADITKQANNTHGNNIGCMLSAIKSL